jgi:hypothetical protein
MNKVSPNAVTHRKQPARQSLLKAVSAIARDGNQDLLKKGRNVRKHEFAE